MSGPTPAVVARLVHRHAEEVSLLAAQRAALHDAPEADLATLAAVDARIEAHLDGLYEAGNAGVRAVRALLAAPGPGEAFAAIALPLEARDAATLADALAALEACDPSPLSALAVGVADAFDWVAPDRLRGVVQKLLGSSNEYRRALGLRACARHGVAPGRALIEALDAQSPRLRRIALDTAGELATRELREPVRAALRDSDPDCRLSAALAALRVGAREEAIDVLRRFAIAPGPQREASVLALATALEPKATHALLQEVASAERNDRLLAAAAGRSGDPAYIPWLLELTDDQACGPHARASIALITGMRIAAGPRDDALGVAGGVRQWWANSGPRWVAGVRHLLGAPADRSQCLAALEQGRLPERRVAAYLLSLTDEGTQLFNTSAPAWRQRRSMERVREMRSAENVNTWPL